MGNPARNRRSLFVPLLIVGCATTSSTTNVRPFIGIETEQWLVEESAPIDRDDVLPAFQASARSYGCSTEQLGNEHSANIAGESRGYYGISAACEEGTIALITLAGHHVSIGCTKPTTHEACDLLLRNISQAR